MPRIVVFDEAANPQKVLSVTGPSENEGPWNASGRTDFVVDPDLTAVSGIDRRYWKHEAGSIVPMTAGEQSAQDAADAAALTASRRQFGKDTLDDATQGILLRAFADIVKDEFNIVRGWTRDFQTEVAAATNLADFKARVATLPTLNDRTLAQLRAAIQARIDTGNVDA